MIEWIALALACVALGVSAWAAWRVSRIEVDADSVVNEGRRTRTDDWRRQTL